MGALKHGGTSLARTGTLTVLMWPHPDAVFNRIEINESLSRKLVPEFS